MGRTGDVSRLLWLQPISFHATSSRDLALRRAPRLTANKQRGVAAGKGARFDSRGDAHCCSCSGGRRLSTKPPSAQFRGADTTSSSAVSRQARRLRDSLVQAPAVYSSALWDTVHGSRADATEVVPSPMQGWRPSQPFEYDVADAAFHEPASRLVNRAEAGTAHRIPSWWIVRKRGQRTVHRHGDERECQVAEVEGGPRARCLRRRRRISVRQSRRRACGGCRTGW